MSKSRFLALFFLLGLIALLPGLRSHSTHAQMTGIRSQDWAQTTATDFAMGEAAGVVVTSVAGGELRLVPGATTGVYTSPVVTATFPFNAVVPHWRAVVPEGSVLWVELRVHTASDGWSPWYPFEDAGWIAAKGQFYPETPLLLSGGQQFQYRATMTAAVAGQVSVLDEMTVAYIDATAGPTTSQAKAAVQEGPITAQDVPQPTIISRDGWGADESLRYDDEGYLLWPLEYRTVEKIVVHHTVSANDYLEDEAAGLVRAIYYYHAVTLGWGDFGYNYLADKYGNIYEGRYGGPGVVGGHVYGYNYGSMGIGAIGSHGNTYPPSPPGDHPTQEALTALADLSAWEANRSYIHPLEGAPFYDVTTPNLAGHRDYSATTCPGDYLYAELPDLRQAAWQRIVSETNQYHVDWLAWNTPPHTLLAAETYSLTVTVRNTGWFTWPKVGTVNSVRLGYHWFDSNGQQVVQPLEDDHRGPLDRDLTFGHTYDFAPAQVTTPITPGAYTLAWDMVHEGASWFHTHNAASPLLTMTLTITDTPPVTIAGRLVDVRGGPVSGGQVALPNWITVTADSQGAYTLPRLARIAYTLTASAKDYAPLPPAYGVDATDGDVTYFFVLASEGSVNLLTDGGFENGLTGWARGGITASLPVSTAAAHTGLGAAQLGGNVFSGTVWLSQTVSLPTNALSSTLSLLYRVPVAGDDTAFLVVLGGETATLTHTLPLTATGWTHFWADVPSGWEGFLDLQLKFTQSGTLMPATVLIDEAWLGYQGLEYYFIHLPLVLKTYISGSPP